MSSIIRATTTSGLQIAPDNSGSLILQTNGTTTALTIDTSQNVGIGTTSPTFKLDVNGRANISQSAVIDYEMLTVNQGYAGSSSRVRLKNTSGGSCDIEAVGGVASTMAFRTADLERMRINSSGNVLVGTTSYSASTDGVEITSNGVNVTGNSSFNIVMNKASNAAQGAYLTMFWGGGLVGYINYNGSGVNYNTGSDVRLKKNIVDAPSAINVLNNVKVRSFDWISENIHDDFGFVAQELYEVYPKAVTSQKDNEDGSINMPWAVDYSKLVPVLTKAIQEQQTIINDLKARIETLEAK